MPPRTPRPNPEVAARSPNPEVDLRTMMKALLLTIIRSVDKGLVPCVQAFGREVRGGGMLAGAAFDE
jgi:hypothetical protein